MARHLHQQESSSFSPTFCESMFDDICSSVVHSLHDSPFSFISPLTLSNHLILGLPLFRTFPPSFFVRSALLFSLCLYQFRILYWTSIAISPTFGASIPYLSFLILSTFVTSHIHRSNLFYCAFCNVPAPILPVSRAASPRIFTFIFCHPTLHRFSSSSSNRSAR